MGARQTSVAAVSLLLALLAAACADDSASTGTRRVDPEQVETLLVQRQRERNPALRASGASCPEEVEARQGETFRCTVEVEGQAAQFVVTIAEILGGRARYEFRPVQAIVDVQGVAAFVRSRLEEPWRTAQVDCGQSKVRLVEVGGVIECTAFDGTSTRYIQAVVEDRDGTVSLRER